MRRTLSQVLVGLLLVAFGVHIGASGAGSGAWAAGPATAGQARGQGHSLDPADTDRWVVEFAARADLRGAERIDNKRERGRFVRDRLVDTANRSQGEARRAAAARGARADSHWLRNVMIVEADAQLVAELRKLSGVTEVRRERAYPLVRPVPMEEAVLQALGDPDWGGERIGAPDVWDAGILGGGVVVANIDTGVDYSHPALVEQYRGNLGGGGFDHDHNWWDPTGICGPVPCDNDGHGTHTMGTMVGGDGPGPFGPDIGVAPGARWIAAKGCEEFFCTEGSLLSSGEFMVAPWDQDGQNPDPGRAPHVVNNSWGGGPGDDFYLETVQAWRAAGIIPVFAAGNPGPRCGDGGSPGDYNGSFSAGATDIDDEIASFSGRGPSAFGKVNPDVAAPGVNVLSSVPGGDYESFSGTSMAAPHVAGALALMLSAQPDLIGQIDEVTDFMRATALGIEDMSCGGDDSGVPNNVYGHGLIDAVAAVELVATGGTLAGTITDAATGAPIGGARISATGPERTSSTFAKPDGTFRLFLGAGTYVVSASAFGYGTEVAIDVEIVTDETTALDLALTALPRFTVSGQVLGAENGSVIAGATVHAVGTPLAPVTSDRQGRYSIVLPQGTHLLEASKGGCMQRGQSEVHALANITQNLFIARKLDRFGHGCDPTGFQWQNVKDQSALYGDDSFGRLRLPFRFPFYGDSYGAVFVDSNGYLAFQDPVWSEHFNTAIPSGAMPNAAIYALWQDLLVDEESAVEYSLSNARAVIEYRNVRASGGEGRGDLQVTLHRDGSIDLAFGRNLEALGAGRRATIGLENATGTDAFQFGFRENVAEPGTAVRFRRVATSVIRGTVTNANDGLPVEGATVIAMPGGQTGRTGPDGTYELRVIDGSYTVEASAPNYVRETKPVTVGRNRSVTLDFSLKAARAEVAPDAITATVEAGEAAEQTVTVTNTGSAPLTYEVRERDFGGIPPELPPAATQRLTRQREWARAAIPDGARPGAVGPAACLPDLDVIIDDPAGDAAGSVDVTTVRGGSDGTTMSMALEFTPGTPMSQVVGYVHLDTDRDPSTGLPPDAFFGLPTQDIGMDYLVDLFDVPWDGSVLIWDVSTFDLVAIVPAAIEGQSLCFDVPTDVFGFDHDGTMDVTMVAGNDFEPTDWAPDVGHGTIEPYRDAPWMAADPETGTLEPGESMAVTVTLGGEGVDPGDYSGLLVFETNDPRQPQHVVEVTLEVTLPEDFGAVSGTVTDAFTGIPIAGAIIAVEAERHGEPYPVAAMADEGGSYLLFGPAGTWPAEVSADGYVTELVEVTIVAGHQASADVDLNPMIPRAVVEGGPLAFTVEQGGSASATLTVGNDGFDDLLFSIGERAVAVGAAAPARGRAGTLTAGTTSQQRPAGSTARAVTPQQDGAQVLVLMDALPWDSAAMLDLLAMHGIFPDIGGSADMGLIGYDMYDVVIVANDQPQPLYDAYNAHLPALEDFVAGGGLLWVGAATFGWNDGGFAGGMLPGGTSILEFVYEEFNDVVNPGHPAMAGVPDPFFGEAVSHSAFDGLEPGTDLVAAGSDSGLPTLIEYAFGGGQVLATAQTLEFGFEFGQDAGLVLENLVAYAAGYARLGDVPWLFAEPPEGTVAPGDVMTVTVTVDASDLEPGIHEAMLVFMTNDPHNRRIVVPVTVEVTAGD